MKQIAHLSSALLSIVLGVLLFFYSFIYFEVGAEIVVIGIFALIAGVSCITFGVFDIVGLNAKVKVLNLISGYALQFAFPLYYFVYALILLIDEGSFFGLVGWLEMLFILIGSSAFIALHIIGGTTKKSLFTRFSVLGSFVFIVGVLLTNIFSPSGVPVPIGSILVPDVLMFACYAYILFGVIKNMPEEENKESKAIEETPEENKQEIEQKEEVSE